MGNEKEREYGLIFFIGMFVVFLYVQTDVIIKSALLISITLLLCFTTFINWCIRLSDK